VVQSAHPSPLSARSGFFGSRPFSQVNALLEQQDAAPIDWALPDPP
jgi:uracil-DNA glycosylase